MPRMSLASIFFLVTSFFVSVSAGIIFHILSLVVFFRELQFWKKIKYSKSFICFIGLTLWALVSSLSSSIEMNDFSILAKTKYLVMGIISLPACYLFLDKSSDDQKRRLFKWLFITLGVALIGSTFKLFLFPELPLFKLHRFRIGGFTGTMKFGYTASMLGAISFACFFDESKKRIISKKWLLTFFILVLLSLLLAQTRGALLGLIVAVAFILARNFKYLRKYLFMIGFLGISSFLIVSPYFKDSKFRFLMPLKAKSNMIRLSLWQTALYMIKDHPIFGVGSFQFREHVKEYKEKYDLPFKKHHYMHTHNSFIEPFVSWGIPGGILFLLWIFLWFLEALKMRYGESIFIPFLIVVFIQGQFDILQTGTLYFVLIGAFSFFTALKILEEEVQSV